MSKAKVLHQKTVFEGKVFKVRVDRIIEPSGQETTRDIVLYPGAVSIVARPNPNEVILVRQYRHAAGIELLEIPAGGLKEGEDPREAAMRELEEETGFRASAIRERGRFWTTPGFTTEFMHLYEATDLVRTQTNPDEDEVIEVDIIPNAEALRMIDDGRIQDAKSILGLLRILR